MSADAWYVIVDSNGRGPITEAGGKDFPGQIAEAKYLITDPREIEANANLLAAAPDLLALLERACLRLKMINGPDIKCVHENPAICGNHALIHEIEEVIGEVEVH